MAEESSKNGLVRIGQQTITRYSSTLLKRAIEELKARVPNALQSPQKNKRAILIHAKDQYPEYIIELLGEAGLAVDLFECYNEDNFNDIVTKFSNVMYDIVIPTNLGLSPWYMPNLVTAVRQVHPKTKVLVISGYDDLNFVMDLKRRGIDDFLFVLYEPENLFRTVSELI